MSAVLESRYLRFEVSEDGSYRALDKQTNVTWRSSPYVKRFGSATVKVGDQVRHLSLDRFELSQKGKQVVMGYTLTELSAELRFRGAV